MSISINTCSKYSFLVSFHIFVSIAGTKFTFNRKYHRISKINKTFSIQIKFNLTGDYL